MDCKLVSVRLWAARPAAWVSRLMRSSSTAITSAMVDKFLSEILKLLVSGSARAKVPMPWRVSTSREVYSLDKASRTTVLLTSNLAMISDSLGGLLPGLICPLRMLSPKLPTISCTS